MFSRLPPEQRGKSFRQSLKQFVIMARNTWSLHQNYPHTTNLTETTPWTKIAPINLQGFQRLRLGFEDFNQRKSPKIQCEQCCKRLHVFPLQCLRLMRLMVDIYGEGSVVAQVNGKQVPKFTQASGNYFPCFCGW